MQDDDTNKTAAPPDGAPTRSADDVRHDLNRLAETVGAAYPETVAQTDLILGSVVAQQNCAMVGPPGVAKTEIADAILGAMNVDRFSYLLTRFTEPNEVLGAVDLGMYRDHGRYVRNIAGMLPAARIAFLDEAFKANSAILNALLEIMNERRFNNGGAKIAVPLRTVVMASNEVPDGTDLAAFWDRADNRVILAPPALEGTWISLIQETIGKGALRPRPSLSGADLDAAHCAAMLTPVSVAAAHGVNAIRLKLVEAGIVASPRRIARAVRYLKARAWLAGRPVVEELDLDPLKQCLWSAPDQIPAVGQAVDSAAATWIKDLRSLTAACDEVEAQMGQIVVGDFRDVTAVLRGITLSAAKIAELTASGRALADKISRPEITALVERIGALDDKRKSVIRRLG